MTSGSSTTASRRTSACSTTSSGPSSWPTARTSAGSATTTGWRPPSSRGCLREFAEDPRLILVTTQLTYAGPDGDTQTARYDGTALRSADPVDRFTELLRLLNESHLLIDPLYAMVRRAPVAAIPRRNMLHEDQVFAVKLALAGPWGHVPEVLAHRGWKHDRIKDIARRLDVPAWQSHFANTLQCREILRGCAAPTSAGRSGREAAAAVVPDVRAPAGANRAPSQPEAAPDGDGASLTAPRTGISQR